MCVCLSVDAIVFIRCSFKGEKVPHFENEVSNEITMINMGHCKKITKKSVPSNNPKRRKDLRTKTIHQHQLTIHTRLYSCPLLYNLYTIEEDVHTRENL